MNTSQAPQQGVDHEHAIEATRAPQVDVPEAPRPKAPGYAAAFGAASGAAWVFRDLASI